MNEKAKTAFAKTARALAAQSKTVRYKFADITGDGIVEMLAFRYAGDGMWCDWRIYTWKSDVVSLAMNETNYGEWARLTAYP